MGVMGHYVGDGAQPLHTTIHHNGWVGPNPNGYTTANGIHAWIDGGFIGKANLTYADLAPKVAPAQAIAVAPRPDGRDPLFVAVVDYFVASQKLVEPLYALDKANKFRIEDGQSPSPEGRAFIDGRLLKGGEMLGAIWLTAWRNIPADTYLRTQLLKRQAAATGATPAAAPAPASPAPPPKTTP
jgi:hypothetical protein